jgi:hypothetical protein
VVNQASGEKVDGNQGMKNRLISLAALSVAIPTLLVAQPIEKNDLTGVWALKVTPHDAPRTILVL